MAANNPQDADVIMRALQAASASKTDIVVDTWVSLPASKKEPLLATLAEHFRKTSDARKKKEEVPMSPREVAFEKEALSALADKLLSLTSSEQDVELLTSLLALGRRGSNEKSTARCYELLWPLFGEVQDSVDDLADEDETLADDEDARGKNSIKNKGRSTQFPSDVEQFEAVVGTFAVIASCTLSKKSLVFTCGALKCTNKETTIGEFKRCGRCKSIWYCSRECQVKSWKKDGHKKTCGKPSPEKAEKTAAVKGAIEEISKAVAEMGDKENTSESNNASLVTVAE